MIKVAAFSCTLCAAALVAATFVPIQGGATDVSLVRQVQAEVPDRQAYERRSGVLPPVLLAQPLFMEGRSALADLPQATIEVGQTTAANRLPVMPQLIGLMSVQGSFHAYFADFAQTPRKPGDQVAGWSINAIDSDGVTLKQGNDTRRILLREQDAKSP